MEYIPVRVSDVIRQLNRDVYLPAIQRELVWGTDRIEVILPHWRARIGEEPSPLASMTQTLDDGYREFPGPFAGVFICRSDDWTPRESHDAFREFLDLAPEPVGTVQLLACPGAFAY